MSITEVLARAGRVTVTGERETGFDRAVFRIEYSDGFAVLCHNVLWPEAWGVLVANGVSDPETVLRAALSGPTVGGTNMV